jgi:tRNA-specific 2-thiouridylase
MNILIHEELVCDKRLFGKIRSYGALYPCKITEVNENNVTVQFDEPQFAPCPGQKLVLYNSNDNVIAGGTIV